MSPVVCDICAVDDYMTRGGETKSKRRNGLKRGEQVAFIVVDLYLKRLVSAGLRICFII